jgi:hypothetical protein
MKSCVMTFKGRCRSLLSLTEEEHRAFTDDERAEFISVTRRRLSTEFARRGHPRNWKWTANPARGKEMEMQSLVDNYSAWSRGEWNDTPGVPFPPSNKPRLG